MYDQNIIKKVSQELIDADFRDGFENSVINVVRDAIKESQGEEVAMLFWNDFCNFSNRLHGSVERAKILQNIDEDTLEIYLQAVDVGKSEGCFVMPSWGTYGT